MLNKDLVLPQLISVRAHQDPDHVVVHSVERGPLTMAELDAGCRTWADALGRLGVGADDTVVTMMPNSFEAFFVWNGCAWLKAVEVPVNTGFKGLWLRHVVNVSRAKVLVTSERYVAQVAQVAAQLEHLETVVVYDADPRARGVPDLPFRVVGGEEFLSGATPTADLEPPNVWNVMCVLFTSGTTGPSKGVVMPWGQIIATVAAWPESGGLVEIPEPENMNIGYSPFAPYHISGKGPLYNAVALKGRVVTREVFTLDNFWSDIHTYGCTSAHLIGAMTRFIFDQPPRPDDAENSLKRVLMVPVIPEFREFAERFGVEVMTGYSMTETSMPILAQGAVSSDHRSCGQARAGVELRIVDDHDLPVPPGEVGQLVMRTDEPWTMTLGYLNMPDKTVEVWRNGWFHTGDAFRVDDDGNFFFVDRLNDAIRRRGENISSFEVEAAVNEHPDVQESAAIAVPSELSEDEVMVVIVPRPGRTIDPVALIEFLAARMPRFAVPRYIKFVDEIPKTEATARAQKVKLREVGVTADTWDREQAGIDLKALTKTGAQQ